MISTIRQLSSTSRRRFLVGAAGALAASALVSRSRVLGAFAEDDGGVVGMMRRSAADAKITVEKLRGGVHVLIGSGGNIGVLVGKDGSLLVDAGMAGSRPQLTKALAELGEQPVRHLINTHWHFDHTDGNEWLHRDAGAQIIAHENLRKRMSQPTKVDAWNHTFPPAPAAALPTVTVKNDLTLHVSGVAVVAESYGGPRHTDNDLHVMFPDADVFHAGDTFWNGHYPFIDYSTGGSINGMIQAVETNLTKVGAKTQVIPGHGPMGDKSAMAQFRDVLAEARDKIAAMKKEGKTLKEVVAAKPTAKYDEKWGDFVIDPATFAALVYQGV